jgi:hypothetical protein
MPSKLEETWQHNTADNMIVYVCPGPSDESEECTFWMTGPGYCMYHPHIDLVPKPIRHTTVPPDLNLPKPSERYDDF